MVSVSVIFQLACKTGREMRASELCELMPDSRTVQLAIKYASRLHLMQLAERLGHIAQLKADEARRIESERDLMWYCLNVFMNVFLPLVSPWRQLASCCFSMLVFVYNFVSKIARKQLHSCRCEAFSTDRAMSLVSCH